MGPKFLNMVGLRTSDGLKHNLAKPKAYITQKVV